MAFAGVGVLSLPAGAGNRPASKVTGAARRGGFRLSLRSSGRLPLRISDSVIVASRRGTPYNLHMLDWNECPAVERSPGKVGGEWLFKGTRVPVKALFENLEDGARVDDFLDWFPGVSRQQVEAVLRHAERSLSAA